MATSNTTNASPNQLNMGTVNVGGTPDLKAFNQSMVSPDYSKLIPQEDLASFKAANPNIPFDKQEYTAWQNATTPIAPTNIPQSQSIATFGTQPVNIPGQNIPQPTTAADQAARIIQQTSVPESEMQKKDTSLAQTILDIAPNLAGKTQEKFNAVQSATKDLKQRYQDLSSQIYQKNAEIQKDDITLAADLDKLQGGGILKSIVNTQQYDIAKKAQITRSLKMADANMLNAQALALNGQITLAKETAEDAVNAKYSVFEDIINVAKTQREAISSILTADEKKQAREQNIKADILLKDLERQKQNEADSKKMLVAGIAQGMPQDRIAKAQDLINKGASSDQVAAVMGIYAGDVLDRQIKQAQLAKLGIDLAKGRKELATSTTTLSPEDLAKFNSTPQAKDAQAAIGYAKAARDYKKAIQTYGTGEEYSGYGKGQLGQAYSALVGATKDYYKLGTLDNGVQKLIDLGISEPSVFNRMTTQTGALDKALTASKETMRTSVNQLAKTAYKDTVELQSIADEVAKLEMETMTMDDLLNQLPSQGGGGQDNSAFFGSNTTTPAMVK